MHTENDACKVVYQKIVCTEMEVCTIDKRDLLSTNCKQF